MTSRAIPVVGALALLMASAHFAEARPFHHSHHQATPSHGHPHAHRAAHRGPRRAGHHHASRHQEARQGGSYDRNSGVFSIFSGGSDIISESRRFLGGNPIGWRHNWCAEFLNMVLRRTGHSGTGSAAAISFARYGRSTSPHVGAIAVQAHHVSIVTGLAPGGVYTISGNHRHKVGEGFVPFGRIVAFRDPA